MINHVFDLAMKMPAHLAIMFSMSWFGIPATDPQGAGADSTYAQYAFNDACTGTEPSAPTKCDPCILVGTNNQCAKTGAAQRRIASRRRPLAGIYSVSGLDAESKSRVDLMLSNVRRACDDGAKLDAWAVQMNGLRDTSYHPSNPQSTVSELTYEATLAFFAEAEQAGMKNVIIPAQDTTWYFKFGSSVGLGKCDDSTGNPKSSCTAALSQDLADMSALSDAHPAALQIDGRPMLYVYYDPQYLTLADWQSILQTARNTAKRDFYVIGVVQGGSAAYFPAFDALAPWLATNWSSTSGSTVRAHATAYTKAMAGAIFTAAASNPQYVALAGVTPGFDDYTENWYGNDTCTVREVPSSPDTPRDPDFLLGEFDYYRSVNARGAVMETWDDWTEGTEFEPDVEGGTSMLVSLRDNLGQLFGEASDPSGDQRLTDRWVQYGQMRNCADAGVGALTTLSLTCTPGSGDDAGVIDDAGTSVDASVPDENDGGVAHHSSGSGCSMAPRGTAGSELICVGFLLSLGCLLRRRRTTG